jgi:hypothetical protein
MTSTSRYVSLPLVIPLNTRVCHIVLSHNRRNQININNNYPREFHKALTLISQLMDNPYLCFQNGMSSDELVHLLRISEHFQFTELSEQVMIVLARRLEDAAGREALRGTGSTHGHDRGAAEGGRKTLQYF